MGPTPPRDPVAARRLLQRWGSLSHYFAVHERKTSSVTFDKQTVLTLVVLKSLEQSRLSTDKL